MTKIFRTAIRWLRSDNLKSAIENLKLAGLGRRAEDRQRRVSNVTIGSSVIVDGKPQGARRVDQTVVIAGEADDLSLPAKKVHGRQMECVQGPNRFREGFQRSSEHRRGKFNYGNPAQQRTHFVTVRAAKFARMDAGPDLVLKKTAGDQRLLPEAFRRRVIFGEKMRERHRSVEVDQRPLRSCSSSRFSWRKDITGLRGGTPADGNAGGVIHPWRMASASKASASSGLLLLSGGTISATTRSRSVTSTVSPRSAKRTYSLSLFFRIFNPTARMVNRVASRSSLCQGRAWVMDGQGD
jgi:hypothetical protein